MRAGEGDYRPTGNRTVWLPDLDVPDDLWASFQIPIGLAFFMHSTVTSCVVAMYPSPAGATESELHFETWRRMVELNPVLDDLESDIEGLIVNRLTEPPMYAIAPIDRCYALTGTIKLTWEGISGGSGVGEAVSQFFEQLRREAVAAMSIEPIDRCPQATPRCPILSSPSSGRARFGTRQRRCWRSTSRCQSRAAGRST